MYRYSVDNAVTYTSEDFVLFRESPFAAWMERLTLENPDHGIPADVGSAAPRDPTVRQDDVADTLRAEGRDVALIDWQQDEAQRRSATLDAMRSGVEFIVNGQLALGPLSGTANLLMRTSGYSDFGGFLYIPCDTQDEASAHSAFRLCFLADLLHSLQGQLPPQLLIIRDGADLESMHTDEHIYHYRAVKQRFMEAMRSFRKHRMPDPAESAHFGRWSDCANEVLRQRALRDDSSEAVAGATEDDPLAAVLSSSSEEDASLGQAQELLVPPAPQPVEAEVSRVAMAVGSAAMDLSTSASVQPSASANYTLAEQALRLAPGAYAAQAKQDRPGFTPNLVASGYVPPEEEPVADDVPDHATAADPEIVLDIQPAMELQSPNRRNLERRVTERREPPQGGFQRRSSDVALENLQFIGSNPWRESADASIAPPGDTLITGGDTLTTELKPHPLDSAGFNISMDSVVDMDIPLAPPAPVLETESMVEAEELDVVLLTGEESGYDSDNLPAPSRVEEKHEPDLDDTLQTFSDSLFTNERVPD